jgi:hypothetical protein
VGEVPKWPLISAASNIDLFSKCINPTSRLQKGGSIANSDTNGHKKKQTFLFHSPLNGSITAKYDKLKMLYIGKLQIMQADLLQNCSNEKQKVSQNQKSSKGRLNIHLRIKHYFVGPH